MPAPGWPIWLSAPTGSTRSTSAQGVVRQYRTDQVGQVGATEIFHTGMSVDGQPVDAPVAMTYLPDSSRSTGALAVVDRGRDLLLALVDGTLVRQPLARQQLAASCRR